jgi:hypothetical protein
MHLINHSLLGSAITAFFLFHSPSISRFFNLLDAGGFHVPWVSRTEFEFGVRAFNRLPSKCAVLQNRPAWTRPQFLDGSMLPTLRL